MKMIVIILNDAGAIPDNHLATRGANDFDKKRLVGILFGFHVEVDYGLSRLSHQLVRVYTDCTKPHYELMLALNSLI